MQWSAAFHNLINGVNFMVKA